MNGAIGKRHTQTGTRVFRGRNVASNNNHPQEGQADHRERLVYTHLNFVGRTVTVKKINGVVIEGIFVGASSESAPWEGCVLQYAKIKEQPEGVVLPSFDPSDPVRTKWEDIVYILAKDAAGGNSETGQGEKFRTDTDISTRNSTSGVGRPLQATDSSWLDVAPNNLSGGLEDEKEDGNWDQFKVNEEKFGVKNTFDENLYTTPLQLNKMTSEQIRKAEQAARDIESQVSNNVHLMEERGQKGQGDYDEESRYSSVIREEAERPQEQVMNPSGRRASQIGSRGETEVTKMKNEAPDAKSDVISPTTKPLSFAAALMGKNIKSVSPNTSRKKENISILNEEKNNNRSSNEGQPSGANEVHASKVAEPAHSNEETSKPEELKQPILNKHSTTFHKTRSEQIAEFQKFSSQLEGREKEKKMHALKQQKQNTDGEYTNSDTDKPKKELNVNAKEWTPTCNPKTSVPDEPTIPVQQPISPQVFPQAFIPPHMHPFYSQAGLPIQQSPPLHPVPGMVPYYSPVVHPQFVQHYYFNPGYPVYSGYQIPQYIPEQEDFQQEPQQ